MTKIGIVGPIAMSGMKSGFEMSVDFDMHWWFSRNSPGSMRDGLEDHGYGQLRFQFEVFPLKISNFTRFGIRRLMNFEKILS